MIQVAEKVAQNRLKGFVEWPLASNLRDAEELAALAKRKGVRAVVGLQGRLSSVINKVKQMVEEGRIGDVLSTTFVGAANEGGRTARETYDYFYNSKVGGNMLTIHVAHSMSISPFCVAHCPKKIVLTLDGTDLDNITWALGEIESLTARLSIAQPEGRVINLETGRTVRIVIRDTPDQVMFHGTLTNSTSASKVPISYHVRGPPFKGEPPFRWNIYGTKGEFLIVNPELMAISVIDTGATIRLHDFESGNVQDIQWTSDDATAESSLPQSAKNVSRLYEAFANGEMHKLVTFEEAVVRHRMVDMIETNSQF